MLNLNDIIVRLGGETIIDRANAALPTGSRVGLVGRNGAGKSTLMRVVAGMRVGREEGIEQFNFVAPLPKHCSGDGAGAAATVQPDRPVAKLLRERLDELRREPTVARVVDVVLVVEIVLELGFGRGQVLHRYKGGKTGGAALVSALIDSCEVRQLAFTANAADAAKAHDGATMLANESGQFRS